MGPVVDVWAGLRILGQPSGPATQRRSSGGPKVAVEFKVPDLVFAPDDRAIARELANELAAIWRDMWLSGQWLDGRPLPTVNPKTAERRQDRLQQIAGGARPLRRAEHRSLAKLLKRYQTRKQGTTLPTAELSGRNLVGLESGTTARSLAVAPAGGDAFQIFVSNIRGVLDRSGASAWLRVLKLMGGIGRLTTITNHPRIQAALVRGWQASWRSKAGRVFSELGQLKSNLEGVLSEAEQIAQADGR